MLTKANSIIGHKVIAIDSGREIAKVQDVIYDPDQNMIQALLVDEQGWFSDAKVITYQDVESIGPDAVMVQSEAAISAAGETSDRVAQIARDKTYLTKTKIVTEQGEELGSITDVFFEPETGQVVQFEVSQGGLKDLASGRKLVSVSDIVTIGKDATIVAGYTKEAVEQQTGGLQQAAETAVAKGKDVTKTIGSQLNQAAQNVSTRVEEIQRDPKVQAEVERVKSGLDQVRQRAEQAVAGTKERVEQAVNDVQDGTAQDRINDAARQTKHKAADIASRAADKAEGLKGQVQHTVA